MKFAIVFFCIWWYFCNSYFVYGWTWWRHENCNCKSILTILCYITEMLNLIWCYNY